MSKPRFNFEDLAVEDVSEAPEAPKAQKTPEFNFEDLGATSIPQSNTAAGVAEQNPMIDTIIGKLPRRMFKNDDEQKEFIDDMIGAYALTPGMNMIGASPTIGERIFSKIGQAFKSAKPAEEGVEAATKAATEADEAAKAAKNVRPGQISDSPATPVEYAENQLGRELNTETHHANKIARGLQQRIASIEKYWSDRYKTLMTNLKDASFQMPKQVMDKLSSSDIYKALQEGRVEMTGKGLKVTEPEKSPFMKELIESAPTHTDTDAASFVSKYKDFRNKLHAGRRMAKTTSDEGLRRSLFKDIDQASKLEKTIKNTLHEGLGEFKPEFMEINQGYSDQIFPLRNHRTARNIMRGGNMTEHAIKELSDSKEGTDVLRELAKQDPEIVRNMLGQRYIKSPSELHNPNELVREYLDEVPEIKKLLQGKEKALSDVSASKKSTLEAKLKSEHALKSIKGAKQGAKEALKISALAGTGLGIPYTGYKIFSRLLSQGDK